MNNEECWVGMSWGAEVDAARGNTVETVRVPSHSTKWSLLGLEGSKNFTFQISTAVPANPFHKYPFDFLFILYYFISIPIPAMYVEGESSPRTFPEALI